MSRTIKVHSTQSNQTVDFSTTAKTWGELEPTIPNYTKGMKVIAYDTDTKEKLTLEFPENKIPTNAVIYLMPTKVKSGLK